MNDTSIHNTRVHTAGGDVPDKATTGRYEALLKQGGLWDSCVFFGQADAGCINDSTNHTSKVFDLMNNADLVQATGTAQPKCNSNGILLYDGGDVLASTTLNAGNPIRTITNKMTAIVWLYYDNTGAYFVLDRWNIGTYPELCNFTIFTQTTTKKILIALSDGVFKKSFASTNTINGAWNMLAFTFDGAAMDGAVRGLLKCYINGVPETMTKTINSDMTSFVDSAIPLSLGGNSVGTAANLLPNGSKTDLPQIYNRVLTDAEIIWNFNNLKPINLLEQYGTIAGTHINRVEANFGQIPMPLTETQILIDKLIANNMWNNCVFFQSAGLVGCKKDTLGAVTTSYDLMNNTDLVQATGTAQPKYNSDGTLLYDGGDWLESLNELAVGNPIRTLSNKITVLGWAYKTTSSPDSIIIARNQQGLTNSAFRFTFQGNRPRVELYNSTITICKSFRKLADYSGLWHLYGFTFDGELLDETNGSNGRLNLFVDGVVLTGLQKDTNNNITSLANCSSKVSIGVILPNGSKTAITQVYNRVLSDAEMLWIYNNIRPNGV